MSKYTTGEIAKLCGVSVRTVQYYDTRNILTPSELTEGGRRLYSEEDLKRMKIICFLRDAGISINSIGELLSEHDPGSVISVLLEQQENILKEEIHERQVKLDMLDGIKQELKTIENFSIESITGIWWPFALYVLVAILYGIWVTKFYFKKVAYICPQCHEVFKPKLKEAIFARHTPTLRNLTCTCCGYKGLCVETYGEEEKE